MNPITFTYKYGKSKALTMSYDDGHVEDRRLVEIFDKYGIRGSFHLNSGFLGKDSYIEESEVKELYKNHEVSCHTLTHPRLERIFPMDVAYEILSDKENLERACGYVVRGMSYPFGTYNKEVIELLRSLGMRYSRTTRSTGDIRSIPEDFMLWDPTCHHSDKNLLLYFDRLMSIQMSLPLLYVWGHSYEFERNNNWELIEEFCQKAGGHEDVWYATNIELYDYITAVSKCEMSADRTVLYNPSAVSVWVKANGNIIECKGGENTVLG